MIEAQESYMEKTWTNNLGEVVAKIDIDDKIGISMQVLKDNVEAHKKDLEELLTLNMYPPRDIEKDKGVESADGKWLIFETKPGTNWEFAKNDVIATFNYWFGGTLPAL